MTDKEIVKLLKTVYPGVDRPLVNKTRRPEIYAVEFIPAAKKLIKGHAAETPPEAVRAHTRRRRYTTRFDTTKSKRDRVHKLILGFGYTITEGMNRIMDYVLEHPEVLER